ncbi:hypothetical protein M569_07156, partial [Genlisea aurea]
MRNWKSALILRRQAVSAAKGYSYCRRTVTSLSCLSDESDNLVVVEGESGIRTAILNRPSSLNALNTSLVAQLQKLYTSWEENPDIGFVILKGAGRSFSAGGDIVSLYNLIKKGNVEDCKLFFWTIYSFIYFLGTYLKPNVALLNGITMGGGAGISIPGTFRIATDKTIFATPETLIGFHPDAAASFYLSHLPGYLGEYLALTGEKLNGPEMMSCGLATHFTSNTKLPLLEDELRNLVTDDPSVLESFLAKRGDAVLPDKSSVIHRIELIDKCFRHDTVEEIIDSLKTEACAAKGKDLWCESTLTKLKEAAPLSLKVSLRSIREGRFQTLDRCLIREYRMSLQGISGKITDDFVQGIRAKLVDKDLKPE